jgi:hypothetical protein
VRRTGRIITRIIAIVATVASPAGMRLSRRIRVIQAVRIAHEDALLDTRNVGRMELVVLAIRLDQLELDILPLYQVLVLLRLPANRRKVDKNVLILMVTFANGQKSETGLVIEPLDATKKTGLRDNNGRIGHV